MISLSRRVGSSVVELVVVVPLLEVRRERGIWADEMRVRSSGRQSVVSGRYIVETVLVENG